VNCVNCKKKGGSKFQELYHINVEGGINEEIERNLSKSVNEERGQNFQK